MNSPQDTLPQGFAIIGAAIVFVVGTLLIIALLSALLTWAPGWVKAGYRRLCLRLSSLRKAHLVFYPDTGGRGWTLKNLGPGYASRIYIRELDANHVPGGLRLEHELAPGQHVVLDRYTSRPRTVTDVVHPKMNFSKCMTLIAKYHNGRFNPKRNLTTSARKVCYCKDGQMKHGLRYDAFSHLGVGDWY